jgi:hypothetical protein
MNDWSKDRDLSCHSGLETLQFRFTPFLPATAEKWLYHNSMKEISEISAEDRDYLARYWSELTSRLSGE